MMFVELALVFMSSLMYSLQSNIDAAEVPQGLPANMQAVLPQQEAPQLGSPRGYVRMAVMDGKTIKHRVSQSLCAPQLFPLIVPLEMRLG
jgi:hypothetical protein